MISSRCAKADGVQGELAAKTKLNAHAHLVIGMAERVDSDAGREIEVRPILSVVDNTALAAGEDDRRAGVGRKKALSLLLKERRDVSRSGLVGV